MREAIERLGLPNPLWAKVEDVEALIAFGEKAGWPIVLKTPRGGYDGKGVRMLDNAQDAKDAADWFANGPLLAEDKVDFSRELSALVARTPSGEAKAWPVVDTIQVDGVCDEVIAPAQDIDDATAATAANAALRIAEEFGVTGVMAAELLRNPRCRRRFRDQRAGHASAQHRTLDHERFGHQPVRAAPACGLGPAAGRNQRTGRHRHEELPRRRQPGSVLRIPGGAGCRPGGQGACLRQVGTPREEDRPREHRGKRQGKVWMNFAPRPTRFHANPRWRRRHRLVFILIKSRCQVSGRGSY